MPQQPVIIISGASRGIGAEVVHWLARRGTALTMVARSEKELERVAASARRDGSAFFLMPGDIADAEFCRNVVTETAARFGRVHGLINNAGVMAPLATVAQSNLESWRYNLEVNLLGPFNLMRWAMAYLRETGGRIVNVSSGAAQHPIAAASAYCAAKAALNHLTQVVAVEEPDVITIAVRPGVVDTAMQALLRRDGPKVMPPSQAEYYQMLKLEGRLEPPSVPAQAIAWLALEAPKKWSGSFVNYDDPPIAAAVRSYFGGITDIHK